MEDAGVVKRFWKQVTVEDRGLALDGRPVRTPGRAPLVLPSDALAAAVAEEWRDVEDTVDPRAMPLTGLANAAIDRIAPDRTRFAASLAAYGENDLLYGSVTSSDIARLLAEQGIELDRHCIELEQPIKELGVFDVPVNLHPDVPASVKVWVVEE